MKRKISILLLLLLILAGFSVDAQSANGNANETKENLQQILEQEKAQLQIRKVLNVNTTQGILGENAQVNEDDIEEKNQLIQENRENRREEVRNLIEKRRSEIRTEVESKKEEIRKMIESRKSEMIKNQEERKVRFEAEQRKRVQESFNHMFSGFENAAKRLEGIGNKIQINLDNLEAEGFDILDAQASLDQADGLLESTTSEIESVKETLANAINEEISKEFIIDLVSDAKESIKSTHNAYKNSFTIMKELTNTEIEN